MPQNDQVILAERPTGMPDETNLVLQAGPMPEAADGEVVLKTLYLSLDPYMRGRMNSGASYASPVEVGQVMQGATVSEVVESRFDGLAPGDIVLGYGGWQRYAAAPGKAPAPAGSRRGAHHDRPLASWGCRALPPMWACWIWVSRALVRP